MAEKGKLETAEVRIRAAYSKRWVLGLMVGILAFVATVVGIVLMVRTEKAEVTAQVLMNDELTMYPAVAELKGYFTYADEEVTHLWKVRVKFVNSGDKTVVGMGTQKNILGEGLNFVFPDNTRILRIEEESETFQSNIEQIEQNHFQIQFSQWRSGEYAITSFYIASEKPLEVYPCPSVPTRDIIDGDVIIQDLTEREPRERVSIIDRLPIPISMAGKVIGGIFAGAIAVGLLIFVIWSWKNSIVLFTWKRRYLSDFFDYLDEVEPKLPHQTKQRFRRRPYELPSRLWDKFEGQKAPKSDMVFDNIGETILYTVVPLMLAFGPICLILILFPA